jgi:hypothetical protein
VSTRVPAARVAHQHQAKEVALRAANGRRGRLLPAGTRALRGRGASVQGLRPGRAVAAVADAQPHRGHRVLQGHWHEGGDKAAALREGHRKELATGRPLPQHHRRQLVCDEAVGLCATILREEENGVLT